MREHLIAFIESVQEQTKTGLFNDTVTIGTDKKGHLIFGKGYFEADKVMYRPPAREDESKGRPFIICSVEKAVDMYLVAQGLAHRVGKSL